MRPIRGCFHTGWKAFRSERRFIHSSGSRRRRFVRGSKVSPTTEDDSFLEAAQIRLGHWQGIVEPGDLLLEEHFGLISLRRERVKGVGEPVVEDGQLGDALGWNDA